MNCATIFCLRRTDVRARTIPASLVAPARGRYSHCPSLPRRGMRPVRRRATLPWNASRAASILLVGTQVSALKRRTCYVTAISPLEPLASSDASSPRSLSRSWCLRRRLLPCSCVRVSRCFRRSFFLFSRQLPVDAGLLPPLLGDPCPPPLLRPLTESQNRSRRNELRDHILCPEERCPRSHYPHFLGSSR